MPIDDLRAVADAEQIGDGTVGIELVCGVLVEPWTGVFDHALAFANGRGGVAAGCVNCGGADDEAHTPIEAERMEYSSPAEAKNSDAFDGKKLSKRRWMRSK